MHGAEHVVFGAFEPDVDRIAREPEGGAGRGPKPGESGLTLEVTPDDGGEKVSRNDIDSQRDRSRRDEAPIDLSLRHISDFGGRSAFMQRRPDG